MRVDLVVVERRRQSSTPAAAVVVEHVRRRSVVGRVGRPDGDLLLQLEPVGSPLEGRAVGGREDGRPAGRLRRQQRPEPQSTQIEDAITSGKYKAFWVWGLDGLALTPVIKQAVGAGIKVACADYTWGPLSPSSTLKPTSNCSRRSDKRSARRRRT